MGVATGADRLRWRIVDLLVHGWDLARATGVPAALPDDLAERALPFAQAQLPTQPRAGRFADPQPVPADAPPIDRLAAFTGRPSQGRDELVRARLATRWCRMALWRRQLAGWKLCTSPFHMLAWTASQPASGP